MTLKLSYKCDQCGNETGMVSIVPNPKRKNEPTPMVECPKCYSQVRIPRTVQSKPKEVEVPTDGEQWG